jgi:transcriptional regulator with XRE-family HTH domain
MRTVDSCEPFLDPLRKLLKQEGISIYRLSRVSGIADPILYGALNRNRAMPSLHTLARIKCALEEILGRPVSLDELVEVRRERQD